MCVIIVLHIFKFAIVVIVAIAFVNNCGRCSVSCFFVAHVHAGVFVSKICSLCSRFKDLVRCAFAVTMVAIEARC